MHDFLQIQDQRGCIPTFAGDKNSLKVTYRL